MTPKYSLNKYTIRYNAESKLFQLFDNDENLIGEDVNGRELGRDAWQADAEEVVYDYDLALDEKLPLTSIYEKYKARS
jgi:hypothetical protein